MENQYTVGFAFSPDKTKVALILKKRPRWQRGLLNGIGGKKEEKESFYKCISREFEQEAGVHTDDWSPFCEMNFNDSYTQVIFYLTFMDLSKVKTQTDEKVGIFLVSEINKLKVVPDLKWLIPMALNYEKSLFYYVINIKSIKY